MILFLFADFQPLDAEQRYLVKHYNYNLLKRINRGKRNWHQSVGFGYIKYGLKKHFFESPKSDKS